MSLNILQQMDWTPAIHVSSKSMKYFASQWVRLANKARRLRRLFKRNLNRFIIFFVSLLNDARRAVYQLGIECFLFKPCVRRVKTTWVGLFLDRLRTDTSRVQDWRINGYVSMGERRYVCTDRWGLQLFECGNNSLIRFYSFVYFYDICYHRLPPSPRCL